MKEEIVKKLEEQGHDRAEILGYWAALDCGALPPAVAYICIDSCFYHDSACVSRWLLSALRELHAAADVREQQLVNYIIMLRRRALKSRPEWFERRHEWTNHINRAQHYAGKYYISTSTAA